MANPGSFPFLNCLGARVPFRVGRRAAPTPPRMTRISRAPSASSSLLHHVIQIAGVLTALVLETVEKHAELVVTEAFDLGAASLLVQAGRLAFTSRLFAVSRLLHALADTECGLVCAVVEFAGEVLDQLLCCAAKLLRVMRTLSLSALAACH